jgi:anti-sigma B factor antagonist
VGICHRFGFAIVEVAGRLVYGSASSLRTSVNELAAKQPLSVLLDMALVTDMDAHGIGELVWSLVTIERHGGQMALIAPSAWVRQLLAVTRLDTVFAIYDSEVEARRQIRQRVGTVPSSRNGVERHAAPQPYV